MDSAQLYCTQDADCYGSPTETCITSAACLPSSQDNVSMRTAGRNRQRRHIQVCLAGSACGPLLPLTRARPKGLLMQNSRSPTTQPHIERMPAKRVCTSKCMSAPLTVTTHPILQQCMCHGCLPFKERIHVLALMQDAASCRKHAPASLVRDMPQYCLQRPAAGALARRQQKYLLLVAINVQRRRAHQTSPGTL